NDADQQGVALSDPRISQLQRGHRIEHRCAFQRRTSSGDQELPLVSIESSGSFGDVQTDRQGGAPKLVRHLAVELVGHPVCQRQERGRAPIHLQRTKIEPSRVIRPSAQRLLKIGYAYAYAYAYGSTEANPGVRVDSRR